MVDTEPGILSFKFRTLVESPFLFFAMAPRLLHMSGPAPRAQSTCSHTRAHPNVSGTVLSARTHISDCMTQSFCEDQWPLVSSGLTVRNAKRKDLELRKAKLKQLRDPTPPPGGVSPRVCWVAMSCVLRSPGSIWLGFS